MRFGWLFVLTACQYTPPVDPLGPPGDGTQPPDSPPPITCGDLQCDGNATCNAGPSCSCNEGFAGNGMTCTDIDECADNNGGCASVCVNSGGSFTCATPASCAEIKTLLPAAQDGPFTLFIDGNADKPWLAHCAGMAGTPVEYLTVPARSMYNAGGFSAGTDVITTYTKVRIRLSPLAIMISDRLFASLVGMVNHSGDGVMVTSMPVGVAMDCFGNNSNTGEATLDLRGTPFALAEASFDEGGFMPAHSISLTDDNRRLESRGGGKCGWYGPSEANENPFNDNVTNAALPISYSP